jgi:hypothetical protein
MIACVLFIQALSSIGIACSYILRYPSSKEKVTIPSENDGREISIREKLSVFSDPTCERAFHSVIETAHTGGLTVISTIHPAGLAMRFFRRV